MKLFIYFIIWFTVSAIAVKSNLQPKAELNTSTHFLLKAIPQFSSSENKKSVPVNSNSPENDQEDEEEKDDSELINIHKELNLHRQIIYFSSINFFNFLVLRCLKPYLTAHFTPPDCLLLKDYIFIFTTS